MGGSSALYSITIFASAFLLFVVQPMIARRILPAFGGSTAVWTTCMLFFQVLLVGGYFYADRVARRKPGGTLHAALFAVAVLGLPLLWMVDPGAWAAPGGDPALGVMSVLSATAGLPYFLLSTTGPLVQSWFAREFRSEVPYRLFALSNAGSFLGLLAYPLVIEPNLGVSAQLRAWAIGFAAVAGACGVLAVRSRRFDPPEAEARQGGVQWTDRVMWLVLPALATAMLLAVTNHLTNNVAPLPFLWVLPLSLYLLTFVLCFDRRRWYTAKVFHPLTMVALLAMGWGILDLKPDEAIRSAIPLFSAGLFVICMFCHGEAAARKPAAAHLTEFYLMLSAGGAIGGMLVGLVAPRALTGIYELPFSLTACAVVALFVNYRKHIVSDIAWMVTAVAMIIAGSAEMQVHAANSRVMMRNFYGALRIQQNADVREFLHGRVSHGQQWLKSEARLEPTSYYGRLSGIGRAIEWKRGERPFRAGLIGLGAGTLAVYAGPRDYFKFYEINPQVLELAEREFSFLAEAKGKVEVAIGDGRLLLEREASANYDLLAVDAFSGDTIPVHLLTRESFAQYQRHLAADGILALHISNYTFDLKPVVAALAKSIVRRAWIVVDPGDSALRTARSSWVLIPMAADSPTPPGAEPLVASSEAVAWTDDYSNLIRAIRR